MGTKKKSSDEIFSCEFKKLTEEKILHPHSHITNYNISTNKEYSNKLSEIFLVNMRYNIHDLPNCEKSFFHDALKGFEEFSKLKGYIVYLSIVTSINNKVAYKFDFQDGSAHWSRNKIAKDLAEYLNRLKSNKGIDDIDTSCSKIMESHLKSTLKNRFSLIQAAFESQQSAHQFEVQRKDNKIKKKIKKIRRLEKKLRRMELKKNISTEELANIEIELSNKRFEYDVLMNKCIDKDCVIDHLKETIVKSISDNQNVINVDGDYNVGTKIKANRSNVMLDSSNSSQNICYSTDIEDLLNKIVEISQSANDVSKSEYIEVQKGVMTIKDELNNQQPDFTTIERIVSNLGSISSISSFISQLSPLLTNLI